MTEFLLVEAGERAPQRLRLKALELLDESIAGLDLLGVDARKASHDVRRRLKELRALVCLLRDALPDQGREERDLFRDAAAELAAVRDSEAALSAFDRLRERFASVWTPRKFLSIRRALRQRAVSTVSDAAVEQMRSVLRIERGRVAAWPVDEMPRDDLLPAFVRGYRSARRRMRRAMQERSAARFHQWRRRVKTHGFQTQFFTTVGLTILESHRKGVRDLWHILGDHHDLALIEDICDRSPGSLGSARTIRAFRQFLERRMRELEEDSASKGEQLFQQRTRDWEEHLRLQARAAGLLRADSDDRRRRGPKKSPASRTSTPSAISA